MSDRALEWVALGAIFLLVGVTAFWLGVIWMIGQLT